MTNDPFETDDRSPRLEFRLGMVGALIPAIVFIAGVIVFFVIFQTIDMNALTASGIVGLLVAALFAKNYTRFWDAVMSGVSSRSSVVLLMILLIVSMVAAMIAQTGVSGGFIWLASTLGISGGWFITITFLLVCAIAMSTGTSIGTLFTSFPVFFPAGVALGVDPVLLAGAILSGALFGDNLAPISDSTIVSSSTQRYRRRAGTAEVSGVVRSRAKYSLVAAAVSAVLFFIFGSIRSSAGDSVAIDASDYDPMSLIMLVPVALLLAVAFWKRDIFLAATVGLGSGIVVGLVAGLMTPADILSANEDGTAGGFLVAALVDTLPLIGLGIVVFAMIGVLQAAGVFDLLVEASGRSAFARTPQGAELTIGLGALLTTTIFAGVNGPSMMVFGPVADRIGARAGLHPHRRANVMDCFTLGLGSVVPIGSSFLLIASLLTTDESGTALAPPVIFLGAFYPLVLTVVILIAVLTGWGRRFEGEGGVESRTPVTGHQDARVAAAASSSPMDARIPS